MPAVSQAQQSAMAIAEHNPGALYARNKGLAKMSHQQLRDFASTPRRGLPVRSKTAAERIASAAKSRRAGAPVHNRAYMAARSGMTPKGGR